MKKEKKVSGVVFYENGYVVYYENGPIIGFDNNGAKKIFKKGEAIY